MVRGSTLAARLAEVWHGVGTPASVASIHTVATANAPVASGIRRYGQLGAPWALHGGNSSGSFGGGALRLAAQQRPMATGVNDLHDRTLSKARKLAVPVGALAGTFGSLVGVGGGVLISPIIANSCKTLPQRVISGTSLAAVAATGSAAGYVYWTSGAVDLTSALLIAASAVATAPLGARATHAFDCAMLRRLMAYWLFGVAPLVPLKPYLMEAYAGKGPAGRSSSPAPASSPASATAGGGSSPCTSSTAGSDPAAAPATTVTPAVTAAVSGTAAAAAPAAAVSAVAAAGSPRPNPEAVVAEDAPASLWRPLRTSDAVLVVTGTVAGFASGLLGIGGGTIVTPLLTIATGLPQLSVLGTSLAAMVVPSLVGLAQHARLGNVDWLMAAGLAAGTFVGGTAGGRLAVVLPDGVLEWVFCFGMLYLGRKTMAGVKTAAAATTAKAVGGTVKVGEKAAAAAAAGVPKA